MSSALARRSREARVVRTCDGYSSFSVMIAMRSLLSTKPSCSGPTPRVRRSSTFRKPAQSSTVRGCNWYSLRSINIVSRRPRLSAISSTRPRVGPAESGQCSERVVCAPIDGNGGRRFGWRGRRFRDRRLRRDVHARERFDAGEELVLAQEQFRWRQQRPVRIAAQQVVPRLRVLPECAGHLP